MHVKYSLSNMISNEVITDVDVFSMTGDSVRFGDADSAFIVREKVQRMREGKLKGATE